MAATARGGYRAAGIGSNYLSSDSRDAGDITITGGTISAHGGQQAAGIGGGLVGDGGNVTITGGTISARGGDSAAGIGGGLAGNGGNITITGGTISAHGGQQAAGIGGGSRGDGADVEIAAGAEVTATSVASIAIGPGTNGSNFGSLSNAGQLEFNDSAITIPDGQTVDNSGVMTGDGTLDGNGHIDNSGAIWHTLTTNVTVTDHNYRLEFDANGGTGAPGSMRVYAATLADAGLSLPDDQPTRNRYTFTGWYPDGEATGSQITDDTELSDQDSSGEPVTVTAYAGWHTLPTVTPDDPTVSQSQCQAGNPTDPNVDLPEATDRIHYTIDADVDPGETVTLTATAQNGYAFGDDLGDPWRIDADNNQTATYEIELDAAPDCGAGIGPGGASPAHHTGDPSTGAGLPSTGSPTPWGIIAAAIGLLAAGATTLTLRKSP